MGSDGEYFEIKRNSYIYACYILTFCSDFLLDSAIEEGKRNFTLSENYPSRLQTVRDRETQIILGLLTNGYLRLFEAFRGRKESYTSAPDESKMDDVAHEKYLKLMALLEFYGHFIRCPWEIRVGERNRLMDLSELSTFAKTVLKNVMITRNRGGGLDGPYLQYGRYEPQERCFK